MTIRRKEWEEDPDGSAAKIAASIGFPCFVKPVALGSSVGVSMVRDKRRAGEGHGPGGQVPSPDPD